MHKRSWLLVVLSVVSVVVMAGSVGWAEATGYRGAPDEEPAIDGAGFTVCATGDYPAYVLLTGSGVKTAVAQPGACVTQTVDDADGTYKIQIVGLDGATPFTIGEDEVGGDGGETVSAIGTTDSPDWSWSGG